MVYYSNDNVSVVAITKTIIMLIPSDRGKYDNSALLLNEGTKLYFYFHCYDLENLYCQNKPYMYFPEGAGGLQQPPTVFAPRCSKNAQQRG